MKKLNLTNLGEHTVYYSDFSFPDIYENIFNNFFTTMDEDCTLRVTVVIHNSLVQT